MGDRVGEAEGVELLDQDVLALGVLLNLLREKAVRLRQLEANRARLLRRAIDAKGYQGIVSG